MRPLVLVPLIVLVVAIAAAAAAAAWTLREVPWTEVADGTTAPIIVLQDADGELIVQQGAFQAPHADREDFPDHLVAAVLAAEDQRFYDHFGLDLRAIMRAGVENLMAGKVVQGGSTITQQLVKIRYLEPDRTFKRKLQEAVVALWLEYRLDKDEILARYLNSIYMGSGATGIPAAARTYFDKEVGELTVAESALLAGAIRAPSRLNPITDIEAARNRARYVLQAMAASGRIEEESAQRHSLELATLRPAPPDEGTGSWFSDWAIQEARALASSIRGTTLVRTTLEPELQRQAELAVQQGIGGQAGEGRASEAALVAMRPDGAVVAMVGGTQYTTDGFNRAVQARRQPGSTFKLFVYYAALRAGYGLSDRIEDSPFEIDGWSPENFSERYRGRVTLATAFAESLNAASARLALEVGIPSVIDAARDLGIDAELAENPSLALGTSEVSLIDLTAAYASVRADAAPVEPWAVAELRADGHDEGVRVGPDESGREPLGQPAEELRKLLRLTVAEGTGRNAAIEGADVAGKTGTSQNFRDAWFVGFDEELVVGVWVGNDDNSPMGDVTGGTIPARIWKQFMQGARGLRDPAVAGAGDKAGRPSTAAASEAGASPAAAEDGEVAMQPVLCNVNACREEFPSFRAADCTYQPPDGERRLCPYSVELKAGGEELAAVSSGGGGDPAPRCDILACQSQYNSFRAADCTYQPYGGGPRRLCTVGTAEDVAASEPLATSAEGRAPRAGACNISACEQAYRSFRASDCTYQPFGGGPRQLCTQ